jgi:hypothetical protein
MLLSLIKVKLSVQKESKGCVGFVSMSGDGGVGSCVGSCGGWLAGVGGRKTFPVSSGLYTGLTTAEHAVTKIIKPAKQASLDFGVLCLILFTEINFD